MKDQHAFCISLPQWRINEKEGLHSTLLNRYGHWCSGVEMWPFPYFFMEGTRSPTIVRLYMGPHFCNSVTLHSRVGPMYTSRKWK